MDHFQGTNLAKSSRDLFNKKIGQFITFMPSHQQTIQSILDNPEVAKQSLLKQTEIAQTSANRHMYYSAIVAYLKHTDEGRHRSTPLKNRWDNIQKENWEERRQATLNNEPTNDQKEVAATVKWDDIIKLRDKLPTGSSERLLLCLYTYIPPVRADFYDVRIITPAAAAKQHATSNINQLIFDPNSPANSTLIIRDFKTAAKYKEIKHTLPTPLHAEIRASLQAKPRNFLFVMPTDATRPYDRNGFSKWANKTLQTLFKVPITLTSLRHLYISTLDFNKTKAADLEKIGNSMGHSIAMQKGYQWIEPQNQ